MNLPSSVPTLARVLLDDTDEIIVRHECGEALGAIGSIDALPALEAAAKDPNVEIRETCSLAVALLQWRHSAAAAEELAVGLDENPYLSHDPAPADVKTKTVADLRAQLLDAALPMFTRYRAMFSLRNRGSKEAIKVRVCPVHLRMLAAGPFARAHS